MRIDIISWTDIVADVGSWTEPSKIVPTMALIVSTGVVVKETDEFVVLASDVSDDNAFHGLNYIPKKLIVNRQQLVPESFVPFAPVAEKKRRRSGSSKKESPQPHLPTPASSD